MRDLLQYINWDAVNFADLANEQKKILDDLNVTVTVTQICSSKKTNKRIYVDVGFKVPHRIRDIYIKYYSTEEIELDEADKDTLIKYEFNTYLPDLINHKDIKVAVITMIIISNMNIKYESI